MHPTSYLNFSYPYDSYYSNCNLIVRMRIWRESWIKETNTNLIETEQKYNIQKELREINLIH